MTILREQFDADRAPGTPATEYRTRVSRYEIPCSLCGRPLYVGEGTKREIQRAIERDLENPLVCSECERNTDSAYFE